MAKMRGYRSAKQKSGGYRPGGPYRGNRVGTVPRGRAATRGGSHAGEYSWITGHGPGNPAITPFWWNEPPPLEAADFSGGGWVPCDPTSHLQEIRFVYGLDSAQAQADYLGLTPVRFVRRQDRSVLQVRFRDGGWASYWSVPGTEYTAERLESIYLQMESDKNPGEIIWFSLIGVGASVQWPYDSSAK